jgi:hypothetical protein
MFDVDARFALASAINAETLLTLKLGEIARTIGMMPIKAMGLKSLIVS